MIDLETEELVLLKELPKHLPKRDGKPVAISTLWRWSSTGVKGVQLESVLVGGQRYSTVAAFRRFVEAGNRGKVARPDSAGAGERAIQALNQRGW